jgi:hypothetical protein
MLGLLLVLQVVAGAAKPVPAIRDSVPFARLVEQFSESGGYFDTDNLISNEASYLHIAGAIRDLGVKGGAYLGVGPDQNFSYIALVRPNVAFIVDLRRDNLLLHLLFRSVFETAANRLDFLCVLFGRPAPSDLSSWRNRSLADILGYIDRTPADSARQSRIHDALVERIRGYGIALSTQDEQTLSRYHYEFAHWGLDLRFTSYGRGPQSYYPTIRQLYLERDLTGVTSSFLAREDDFRFLQSLERQGKIIPIVGNFGGTRAFKSIAKWLTDRGQTVSMFYTSNVEFYLFRQGNFRRYVDNVRALPWAPNGLIARSYFGGVMGQPHPQAVVGYASAQLLQTANSFLRRTAEPDSVSYWDLVTRDTLSLARSRP